MCLSGWSSIFWWCSRKYSQVSTPGWIFQRCFSGCLYSLSQSQVWSFLRIRKLSSNKESYSQKSFHCAPTLQVKDCWVLRSLISTTSFYRRILKGSRKVPMKTRNSKTALSRKASVPILINMIHAYSHSTLLRNLYLTVHRFHSTH